MKINLKQLEAFVWVADLGSFRKAARRLNTTQPNISSRISSLETVLQVRLMERDAGSVRLTSRGRELLVHARNVLRATDSLVMASDQAAVLEGTLRLGVTEMVVHTWLREFLKHLKDKFPKITVELTVDLSVNLEKELFERSIDLAFQNGPFGRPSVGSTDLGTYPLVWLASPALGLHSLKNVRSADMARHPILTHARDTQLFEEVSLHFTNIRQAPVRLVPSSNLAACLHMTIDGMGIATIPAAMAARELASKELVEIPYAWVPEALHFEARFDAKKSQIFVGKAADIASHVAQNFTKRLF